jgi:hypothetical protein
VDDEALLSEGNDAGSEVLADVLAEVLAEVTGGNEVVLIDTFWSGRAGRNVRPS